MTAPQPSHGVLQPSIGVGRVIAGTNITVVPAEGTGAVTISATGGGGGGTVDTVVAGTAITVDSTDPANPIVTNNGVRSLTAGTGITVGGTANVPIVTNNGVRSLTAGTNVTITGTANVPIINATGGGGGGTVDTVVAGTAITVDATDPANPIVTNNGVRSLTAGTNVTITGTANVPIINASAGSSNALYAYKPANTTRASDITPTDDPDLHVSLVAGTYLIDAVLTTVSANSSSTSINLAYSGTTTSNRVTVTGQGSTANTASGDSITGPYSFTQTPSGAVTTRVSGYIVTTGSGTFSVQWCQAITNVTGDIMLNGCTLVLTKIA